jgi:hypothetical protein
MLVGVGAWLVGAVAATTGSLYAVNKIGDDLLRQQARQASVATINAEYALQSSGRSVPPSPPAAHGPGPAGSTGSPPARHVRRSGKIDRAAPSGTTKLFVSPGGSAGATCQPGGAYLVYVSPVPGFQVDNMLRGPAAVASVTFDSRLSGYVMTVTCQGGQPVDHVTHDE